MSTRHPTNLKSKHRGTAAIGWWVLVPGARHRLVTCGRRAKVKRCLDTVGYLLSSLLKLLLVVTDNLISADLSAPRCATRFSRYSRFTHKPTTSA